MADLHERFVVDKVGRRVEVILGIEEFDLLIHDLEELEAIRAYDAAKATPQPLVPFLSGNELPSRSKP